MQKRFLHLTPIRPATGGNGLAMRTGMFTEALSRLGRVDVLTIADAPQSPADWRIEGVTFTRVSTNGRVDTRLSLIARISDLQARVAALHALGRPSTTAILSAPVLAEAADFIREQSWSCAVISRSYLLPLLDALPSASLRNIPVVVDLDDDDAALCRQRAELAHAEGKTEDAALLEAEADCYDQLIEAASGRVSMFTCASEAVAASTRSRLRLTGLEVISNGVAISQGAAPRPRDGSLLFVGNLSYAPNIDGVCWFIEHIWPRLRAVRPDLQLVIAGSTPVNAVERACKTRGISLCPDPANLSRLYRQAAAAIVPLRTGSGSRIKLLEAGAHGVPVISTRKGAEGVHAKAEEHLFLSDVQTDCFARACLECLNDRQEALRRAENLFQFVKERHARSRIVDRIAALAAGLR